MHGLPPETTALAYEISLIKVLVYFRPLSTSTSTESFEYSKVGTNTVLKYYITACNAILQ